MVMNEAQFNSVSEQPSRRDYWNRHIENWSKSGLTQVQYCTENNLNKHTFTYWKSKLNKQKIFRPFLPVSIKPDTPADISSFPSGISLSFDDRYRIQLEVSFNGDTLLKLIDLLEAR